MAPRLAFVHPNIRALDDVESDLLVLGIFGDERPLEGVNGLVDWRLRGEVSRWFQTGFASGTFGERILHPSGGRLTHVSVLVLSLGLRSEYRTDRALAVAGTAIEVAAGLGARTLTCGLFGLPVLPSPISRTGAQLLEVLSSAEALEAVFIVCEAEHRAVLEELLAAGAHP